MKLDIDKLDFDRCEDEPIHKPELIQSYGYFLAVNIETGIIEIVSDNISDLFGDYQMLLGSNFFKLLEEDFDIDFLKETFQRAKKTETRLPILLNFEDDSVLPDRKHDYYAVVYNSEGKMIVELEPSDQFREIYSAQQHMKLYATSIAPRFAQFKSLDDMAQQIVDTIRFITDMDRVVLYKFKDDQSGKVIAESKIDGVESYLNLHYPASDIPPQARRLYIKNWIRLMANVDMEPAKLVPTPEESGREPVDMTHSLLRDLSPIHKQYIRNQGLKASLSMSLVTHGKLWGMISCHSAKPRYIAQNVRLECENLSQLFSWHLYAKEEELFINRKERTDQSIDKLLDMTVGGKSIVRVFEENEKEVLSVMDADGFFFFTDTEQIQLGDTPHLSVIKELYQNNCQNNSDIFQTEDMTEFISDRSRLKGLCGILMIPMGLSSKYFTAWFRRESKEEQKWAGNPMEKSPEGSKAERLTPRSSFKVHTHIVENRCTPWDSYDIDVALRFNKIFMSYAFEKQEQLNSDIKYLQLQNKYVNEFLATLAHELRNPLAPIALGLNLLEDEEDPSNKREYMTTMRRQVDHMTTMINDLMDVSRITQNKVKLNTEPLDIRLILRDAVDSCQAIISQNEHEVKINLPENPCYVLGDQTRLAQVFVNLINNAAKYTERGGQIEVSAHCGEGLATIQIKDNGLGIEPAKLEEIFTMFIQMNTLSSQSKSGLGIGLTLVKRLLEMHDGEIRAHSDGLGHGSTFSVSLPLLSSVEEKAGLENSADGENLSEPEKAWKVLIVDDNEPLLIMLKSILKKNGYEVDSALNATDAVKVYDAFRPDYTILDLGLPEMDGFELSSKLKEIDNRTIFFSHSGLNQKENVEMSKKMGFKDHLVKPVGQKVLLEALRKHRPHEV
jgi:light-regulated signal transduction histidine kinase (bacteriophytochrome)/CheY-like chemotaxis protein